MQRTDNEAWVSEEQERPSPPGEGDPNPTPSSPATSELDGTASSKSKEDSGVQLRSNCEPATDRDVRERGLYVVGVGASAGGLDALEQLFGAMPEDTGMAFVVVQHLSPDFKSVMDE